MADDLLLKRVRLLGGPALDLLVEGGRIAEVGVGFRAPVGAAVVDGRGQLAFPGWSTATPIWTRPCGACRGGPTAPARAWPR